MIFLQPLSVLALVLAVCIAAPCRAQTPTEARLTIVDGDAALIRGSSRAAAPVGLALRAGDIVETGKATHLVRIEFVDRTILDLGPRTLVLLRPPLASRHAGQKPSAYVLSGWAKVTAPPSGEASVLAPVLEVKASGSVVVNVLPQEAYAFAESGQGLASARGDVPTDKAAVALAGEQFVAASDNEVRLVSQAPTSWVRDVPVGLRDRLPRRFDQYANADVAPAEGRAVNAADIEPWLRSEPALRGALRPRWDALLRDAEAKAVVPPSPRLPPAPVPATRSASVLPAQPPTLPVQPPPTLPAPSAVAPPVVTERLDVATFTGPDRSAQGGLITPIAFAEREGDASYAPLAHQNGELLVKGQFNDKGQSAWGGVGLTVNTPAAVDASSYKVLRIRLAAATPGVRSLRVRLLGVDRRLQRSGCYPVFAQAVSMQMRSYDIPLDRFAPDEFCGTAGASAASTLSQFFGVEVADALRPVEARAVQFSIGSVSLLK
jgi:hypothetical protein